jgi:hypothetical protein
VNGALDVRDSGCVLASYEADPAALEFFLEFREYVNAKKYARDFNALAASWAAG